MVGKYQGSAIMLGTGEMGSRRLLVTITDTTTGEMKLMEYSKIPDTVKLIE
jgi:hypothetical protein